LDEKNAEVHKISSRVNDLELQIRKEKEECHRYLYNLAHVNGLPLGYTNSSMVLSYILFSHYFISNFQFRMTSKIKKFIKAHARFLKAQEELKRYIVFCHF